jgi:hypothetical protein
MNFTNFNVVEQDSAILIDKSKALRQRNPQYIEYLNNDTSKNSYIKSKNPFVIDTVNSGKSQKEISENKKIEPSGFIKRKQKN